MPESSISDTTNKTTPSQKEALTRAVQRSNGSYESFLRNDVMACPCGVPHDVAQLQAMRGDALGRMHLRRWEPRDDNGYYEANGTGAYVAGARDFEGEP